MTFKRLTPIIIATALGFAAGPALALPSVQNLFTSPEDIWSDDSVELFLDVGTDAGQGAGNGVLDEGDILLGLFNITSFSSTTDTTNNKQLTGIFAVKVLDDTVLIDAGSNPTQGIEISFYTFGAVEAGDAFNWNTGLDPVLGALLGLTIGSFDPGPDGTSIDAGTMALFFEDDGTIINNLASFSLQDAFDQSTDGTLQLVVGNIAANGDSFTGSGPTNPADILGLDPNTQVDFATFNFNGTITDSGFNRIEIGADIHTRNSTISSSPTGSAFPITDQTEFVVEVIPEPAGLAIFGMGLLALGGISRRRRRK